ncbi:hypothetical protein [Kribbella swartbergensis]
MLRTLLAVDVELVSDGGGQVVTPLHPLHGASDVARYVGTLLPGTELTLEQVNGRLSIVLRRSGLATAVIVLAADETSVTRVWLVLNPAKLTRWHRV